MIATGVFIKMLIDKLDDGSNYMLTSPDWGLIYVIDHRGIEAGRRNVEYYYALLRSGSSPKPAAALEALLLAG